MVVKLEAARRRREIPTGPLDHAGVQIDTDITAWAWDLLNQLPGYATAAAAEVENAFVNRLVEIREDELALGIVEVGILSRPDQLAHLERRQRQVTSH